ncbi:hypothetical protein ABT218_16945 [Streptomyces sp. NPDC001455]|uniref:hypothetical protein n=1 Tax=unclassified Streptomyces TaxID=2593676 RepID=UPI0033184DA1
MGDPGAGAGADGADGVDEAADVCGPGDGKGDTDGGRRWYDGIFRAEENDEGKGGGIDEGKGEGNEDGNGEGTEDGNGEGTEDGNGEGNKDGRMANTTY